MRIGNRLGGAVIGRGRRHGGDDRPARTPRSESRPSPWVARSKSRTGDHYYGVYVPTRFGGELTIKSTDGQGRRDQGPRRRGADQRPGRRRRPAGWYTFRVDGREEALHGRDQVRPGRRRAPGSPGTSTTGRPRPTRSTSPGPAATAGSTRCERPRRRRADRHSRAATSRPGRTSSWPGPTACSRPLPAAGDDATWFPNLYDDLTWLGPNRSTHRTRPLLPCSSTTSSSARRPGSGKPVNSQNQDITPLAGPLPRRRGGLDPAQRADPRPGHRA